MNPVSRFVQSVHSMSIAGDDSLLRPRPSEGAVLSLHKVDSQALRCVGDEGPKVGSFIGFIHV